GRFDFERRNPNAADLEHVIIPARVKEIAVFCFAVLIAASSPGAEKCLAAFLAVVPVVACACWPTDLQLADFTAVHGFAVLIEWTHLIAGHRFAGSAVT